MPLKISLLEMPATIFTAGLLLFTTGYAYGQTTGATAKAAATVLAATPPMGWNSWNKFGCKVTEANVREAADALVANGMARLGYNTVTVDDCWMAKTRAADGALQADTSTFPSGIAALAEYVHSKGLKFGIYESPGVTTCQKRPGSWQHETQDAKTFATWGVDFLKYDYCNVTSEQKATDPELKKTPGITDDQTAQILFKRMADALSATGRPIVYSLSNCCASMDMPKWAGSFSQLWRTSTDIADNFNSMLSNFQKALPYASAAKPGNWNDPDMLEIGNGGMTTNEYQTQFSLWSVMASPLLAGPDLTKISPADLAIYSKRSVIAINQDPLGVQASSVKVTNGGYVLTKALANGDKAVALFNPTTAAMNFSVPLKDVGAPSFVSAADLWAGQTQSVSGSIVQTVLPHSTLLYRLTPQKENVYEAEASGNLVTGVAKTRTCNACSGGAFVGYLGSGANTLTFQNIPASTTGKYTLQLGYISGDAAAPRLAKISVNGNPPVTITFPQTTSSWDRPVVGTVWFDVQLVAGSQNTIKIFNDDKPVPDIDGIVSIVAR